jgi:hypothetical protein
LQFDELRVSLNNQGYNIGIHQTAILMKQANVVAIRPRKRHYCPDAGTRHPLGDFLNPALALLGQGLKKSPIGQKLDFANHLYLCKGL